MIQFLFYDKRDGEEGGKAELVKQMWSEGLREDGFSNSKCSMAQRLLNAFINWGKDKVKSKEGKNNRFNGRMRCMDEDRLTKEIQKGEINMIEEMIGDLNTSEILDAMEAFRSTLVPESEDEMVWLYIVWPIEGREEYRTGIQDELDISKMTFFRRVKAMKQRAFEFIKEQK